MNITSGEFGQFQECEKKGFLPLDWEEGLSEITGIYGHYAELVGSKIIVRVFVDHIKLSQQTDRKKYEVRLAFLHKSLFGDILYSNNLHMELELDNALVYAQWQATLIFRLIEGDIESYVKE
jgi:hypothetical protein